jgi:hypothetical protein
MLASEPVASGGSFMDKASLLRDVKVVGALCAFFVPLPEGIRMDVSKITSSLTARGNNEKYCCGTWI